MQDEVTYPSTLDASRLNIIFRSIDSDSESTSEIKIEIAFSKKMQLKFEKIGMKNLRLSKKLHFLRNISKATTKATERVSATNDCSVNIKFLEDVEHTRFFVSGTFFSRTCRILFSMFSGQYNVFPPFPKTRQSCSPILFFFSLSEKGQIRPHMYSGP